MALPLDCSSHPSEEELERYALLRLPEERLAPLEEHLLVCQSCLAALKETDQVVDWMKAAPPLSPQPAGAWGRLREAVEVATFRDAAWIASFAAACLILICAVLLISERQHRESAAPVPVTLASLRGGYVMANAPARTPLDLTIDTTDMPPADTYRLEIVDAIGASAWSGSASATGVKLSARVNARLKPGVYWVRLYSKGTELREFGLQLK